MLDSNIKLKKKNLEKYCFGKKEPLLMDFEFEFYKT
jgi:hypothetical protein